MSISGCPAARLVSAWCMVFDNLATMQGLAARLIGLAPRAVNQSDARHRAITAATMRRAGRIWLDRRMRWLFALALLGSTPGIARADATGAEPWKAGVPADKQDAALALYKEGNEFFN